MSQQSAQLSDSGNDHLHLSARSVLLPAEQGSLSSSSLQRQVRLDCASAEHSPSLRGLGSLTRAPSDPAVTSIESVAAQLAAARPVSWRGSGNILQASWAPQVPGKWLILDCWSGYGGLLLACVSLGMHFHAVSAEMDPTAVECLRRVMPSVVHIPRVEDLCVQMLVPFLKRRNIRGILVGGGSPCQGNSALNKRRRGLADPRSNQPLLLANLVQALRDHELMASCDVIAFLENVGSCPVEVREQYTSWMGTPPVRLSAADCGWVQRDRLYWLAGRAQGLRPACGSPPPDWQWEQSSVEAVPRLRYSGAKPIPAKIHCEQGFAIVNDAQAVTQGRVQAMFPFTREFFHPPDSTSGVSAQAVACWQEDSCRFPAAAYEGGGALIGVCQALLSAPRC